MNVAHIVSLQLALFSFLFLPLLNYCQGNQEIVYIQAANTSLMRDQVNGLHFANFRKHEGKYLNAISLAVSMVKTGKSCKVECVANYGCFSLNLAVKPDNEGKLRCELLATDKFNSSQDFIDDANSHHYSIKSTCDSLPCMGHGICIPFYTNNTHKCNCTHPYYGERCEKEPPKRVYRDSEGWYLSARFSNKDDKNWMTADGLWWYDLMTAQGDISDPSANLDMISPPFWSVNGNEIKITRSDDPTHTALLRTTSNCMQSGTFRSMLTSYGNFRNGTVWGTDMCLGSCSVVYGGNYASTYGFAEAACSGSIQSKAKIGFWCDYGVGDGAVMMIGGGGSACNRADHGIGITEENEAKFGKITTSSTEDFGDSSKPIDNNLGYALNLWIK